MLFLTAVLLLLGCADAGRPEAAASCEAPLGTIGFARMDSAGVRVVANRTPAWDASAAPRVGAEPVLTIGVTEGDAAYEFGSVAAATRMSDGRIVVGDGQARQLKAFDDAGRFLETVGGRGSGPGEYRTIFAIVRAAGDTLWVNDPGNQRVNKLDPALALVETIPLRSIPWSRRPAQPGGRPTTGRTQLLVRGVFEDGSLLTTNRASRQVQLEVTNVSRDSLVLRRVHPGSGATDSLGLILGVQRYEVFTHDGSVWFGDAPLGYGQSLAVSDDRYYTGDAYRFEIEERAPDGRLVGLIRLCEEPAAIDDALIEQVIQERLAAFPPEVRADEEQALRAIPRPTMAPSFLDLRVDAAGRLWARDFTFPGEAQLWKVFDREGRWLGEVETPPELAILEIGEDYLLGRHTNELDVQSVRVHALRRHE